jgi:hypothetical protein
MTYMIRVCAAFVACCGVVQGSLVVSSTSPADDTALPIVAGQTGVGPITLMVRSDSGSINVDDYNIGLRIVPRSGATGTLSFNSGTQGAAPYIIPGSVGFFFLTPPFPSVTTTEAVVADDGVDASGDIFGTVMGSNVNIVNLFFNASTDASGFFDIVLIDQLGAETIFQDTSAATIPFTPALGSSIGVISVVPEPTALFTLGLISMGAALVWYIKKVELQAFSRRR